jgi:hypothetical protein
MSKRFLNQFRTLVLLSLTLTFFLATAVVGFSADTYGVPQTAEVTLAWDPNDPSPDGYRIYQRSEGKSYDYNQPCWTGPGTTGTVYNLEWDTTYYFVVRAYAGNQESADSEEVSFVTASPVQTTYVISAKAGENGCISPSGPVTVDELSDQTFTVTPDSGYHVVDVKVDGQSKGAIQSYTFSQVSDNHTVDASFAIDTHIISATAGANGNITPAGSTSVEYGGSQVFTISPDDGCRVVNVMVDGVAKGAIISYTFDDVCDSHTISAIFAVDSHQINATAGTNGSISPEGTLSVGHLASQSFTINPSIGHHVADVMVDGVSIGAVYSYIFDPVGADHSIHATFAADMFSITATAGDNGSIIPAGEVEVPYGGSQSYTFAANSGFCIAGVKIDGQSVGAVGSYTFSNVTSAHSISVSYVESETVRLHIEAEDGDLVLPMEIADDERACAGGFVWAPAGTGDFYSSSDDAGSADYHFEVPETGDYVIWGRQISNDSFSDSFFVIMDGQAELAWKTKLGGEDIWTWDVVSNRTGDEPRDSSNPQLYRLEAGLHTLSIKQREDGTKLDIMVITNDLSLDVSDLDAAFQAPVIEVDEDDDYFISELDTAIISFNAMDPGNGNLTYAWELPDGGSIAGSGSSVVFTPEPIGLHPCPYRVKTIVTSDATQLSSTYEFFIYVKLACDFNGDGHVDLSDLIILRSDFMKIGDPGWIPTDVNRDGYINLHDLTAMRKQFGQTGCVSP